MFDLSGLILGAIGDDATYNGADIKVLIDHDVEVETEGGVFMQKTLASIESGAISNPARGDVIVHNSQSYSVQSVQSDDKDMLVLEIRKT